jgi:macrolide-specific efflux system membrane fusion protein
MVALAAAIVVALAGYFAYRALHATASVAVQYTTEAAAKMTLTTSVSGTGNIVLGTSATVSPTVSGTVSGLSVQAGDEVTKGQELFTLVNPELDLAVQNAENAYNQAVNSLSQAELSVLQAKKNLSDLKTQKSAQTSSVGLVVLAATTETYDLNTGGVSADIADAGGSTPAILLSAGTQSTSGTLSEAGSVTTTGTTDPSPADTTSSSTTSSSEPQPTSTTTSAPTTDSSTSTTDQPSSTTTSTTSPTQTSLPQNDGASTSTTKAITTLDIEVAEQQVTTAELAVTSAQTQIESAKLALQQAEDNAAARVVTAPIDGTVTTVSISNGDALGNASSGGSSAASATGSSSGSSALVITNLSDFEATVTLAEADIASVAVGQKATLTLDALPNLSLTGKVISVDDSGSVSQGVVSYTVTIAPDVANDAVKGGMTVTADIITSVTADALVVPSSAVKTDSSGANYVQILTDGSPVAQTVEVGTSTDSYIQMVSGLTEGQEVVTQTINPSASATSTTARSNGNSLLNGGGTILDGGGGTPPAGPLPGN